MNAEATRSVSIAEAKAHLSKLLVAVENGEAISITRRGKPVASLVACPRQKQPITADFLHQAVTGIRVQSDDTGSFMSTVRQSERY